jgi:hypothetical protein
MFRLFSIFCASLVFLTDINAGEGMWPLILDSITVKDMQAKGMRLTADDIYSINHASLKDAVVLFGGGCTGEVISPEGLIITNHHCGYSRIQAHSTVEKNYLADGYWAKTNAEELPNPGLTVSFLVRMEDVTNQILKGTSDIQSEHERNAILNTNIAQIRSLAMANNQYQAEVKPFFFGKQYYLFVYEVFSDVRLVGAPPEAIGNFGGDSDNWIWPRHTGDFSIFRIYAGKDNQPAEYSPENVPFRPKKFLNISAHGIQEGDFTMVMGYPAQTDEYLTSDAINMIALHTLPGRVKIRTQALNTIQAVMDKGPAYKLQYASKHKTIANAWKKWMGVVKGVESAGVLQSKKLNENSFNTWAKQLSDSVSYPDVLNNLSVAYKEYSPLYITNSLGGELLNLLELSPLVNRTQRQYYALQDSSEQAKKEGIAKIKSMGSKFFRTSGLEIDRMDLPVLLAVYASYADSNYLPAFYQKIKSEYNGDYDRFSSELFKKSIFTDSVRFKKVFSKPEEKIKKSLMSDPLIAIYRDFFVLLVGENERIMDSLEFVISGLYRKYISGLMTMYPQKRFYPDANFTMRIAYGKVEGYNPEDAVKYSWQSTLDGVLEKENPEINDYQVPQKLKELSHNNDFGPFENHGQMPVCFIASNHTSGGNSGSPVLDANGNLIGINFDRNWEGTVSDYAFNPEVCRNISLDIRYVLFIIDKYADDDRLLDELTIIK